MLSVMVQSGGFLGRLLGPLMKFGLPIMKNVLKSSYKSVFKAVRLTAVGSALDTGIHEQVFGSGCLCDLATLIRVC